MQFKITRRIKCKVSRAKIKDKDIRYQNNVQQLPLKRTRQIIKVIFIKINKVHRNLQKNRFNNIPFFLLID